MADSKIYIVSDSSGEALSDLVKTAALQLKRDFSIVKIPYIGDVQEIKDIVYQAKAQDSIILSAIIISSLRDTLLYECAVNDVKAVDLLQYVIELLKYGYKNQGNTPVLEEYSKKLSAMEYVFLHDDGLKSDEILNADVVVIGVSRTSKTPLCMYLANKGIKAANIPLIPETELPKEIFMVPSDKIVGLTIAPDKLHQIRAERVKTMGLGVNASYADMDRIKREIKYSETIMDSLGCLKIDVTNKAVEEAAQIIMEHLKIGGV